MVSLGDCDIRLGGQGWSEPDWTGVFYPRGLKAGDRLAHYARVFDFVEIDSTFYAIPPLSTVQGWYARTPDDFGFAAKVPQVITHDPDPASGWPRRPLDGDGWEGHLDQFVGTMRHLREKLLALLIQLPPQWHWQPAHLPILDRFLAALPDDVPWVIEFRHRDWLNDAVIALLRERGVTLAMQDLYYMPRHRELSSPTLAYIRLQGKRKEIVRMDALQIERDEALDYWADVVRAVAARDVKRVVLAANNHYQGFAPGTLAALQGRLGLPVARPAVDQGIQLPLA